MAVTVSVIAWLPTSIPIAVRNIFKVDLPVQVHVARQVGERLPPEFAARVEEILGEEAPAKPEGCPRRVLCGTGQAGAIGKR
jgi:hypothetical protein